MTRLSVSICRFREEQRQYFRLARQEVAERNLSLVRSLSLLTAALLLIFLLLSPFLIEGWRPTANHLLLLPASLSVCGIAVLYARRGTPTSRGATLLCLLFEAVLFTLIILIDVLTTPSAPGTFMPLLCVVLPSMFICPLALSYSIVVLFEAVYILSVLLYKDPFIAQYDIFDSIVGIAFSLSLSLVIAQLRARDHAARRRFQQLSRQDFLTDILNKQSFEDAARRYLHSCGQEVYCGLLILDVDNFKQVNDRNGHYGGDRLLRSIGKFLTETFRASDLIGRFGGDEFIVLVKGPVTRAILEDKCRQIQRKMSLSQEPGQAVTCSIGGVAAEGGPQDFDLLFRQADAALYRVKRSGKDRYCLETAQQPEARKKSG